MAKEAILQMRSLPTLLVFAVLAITTSSVPAAVFAAERAPARQATLGGVVAAALAEPQSDRADTAPARCPYHFGSDMPVATFCVYRGVAFGSRGEVCAPEVVVIWSSFDVHTPGSVGPGQPASGSTRAVYLAFVADPELVLQASVDSRQGDRAEVVWYTVGSDEAPQPLAGRMTLRALRLGSSGTADVLSVELREPQRFLFGSCAFASYSGMFVKVIRAPSEPGALVGTVIAPRH